MESTESYKEKYESLLKDVFELVVSWDKVEHTTGNEIWSKCSEELFLTIENYFTKI